MEGHGLGPGGGDYSTKLYIGRCHAEVQTLTFCKHTIFDRKDTTYNVPPIENGRYPFRIPVERLLVNFHLSNPLKYLDESAVRCIC